MTPGDTAIPELLKWHLLKLVVSDSCFASNLLKVVDNHNKLLCCLLTLVEIIWLILSFVFCLLFILFPTQPFVFKTNLCQHQITQKAKKKWERLLQLFLSFCRAHQAEGIYWNCNQILLGVQDYSQPQQLKPFVSTEMVGKHLISV